MNNYLVIGGIVIIGYYFWTQPTASRGVGSQFGDQVTNYFGKVSSRAQMGNKKDAIFWGNCCSMDTRFMPSEV